MNIQLPLGIRLRGSATFENFITGQNAEALTCLKQAVGQDTGSCIYLWGGSGCGKSHLLQAACHVVSKSGERSTAYIPLTLNEELTPGMLEGLEIMDVVCIDDIDKIAGLRDWEIALFHLYNRVNERGGVMVFAAKVSPGAVGVEMPDLRSRLSWGMVLHLVLPDDDIKIEILQQAARERGLQMPDDVALYLLRRFSRNLHALIAMLDKLDYASQVAQRRLTLPFVRATLMAGSE